MKLAVNVDLKKSIYLDERGDRNPNVKSALDYFFIGGIEIDDKDKATITQFIRDFKTRLYPEKDSNTWELKGASNPAFIGNSSLPKEENGQLHKLAAEAKWAMWAKAIKDTRLPYKIHGSFIKLSQFKANNPEATEKDIIKTGFISVAYKFVNCACVDRYLNQEMLLDYTIFPSSFYFDNVTGLQETSLLEAFQEYPEYYPHIANGFCVGQNLNFITNERFDDDDELMMQFVDMQIYALTRFLSPSRGKYNDSANILIDFEEYVYKLPLIQENELQLSADELKRISELHYNIVPLFHDIQNRFHRFGWKDGRPVTSLSLIAAEVYENFGYEAHINMQNFSGMLKPPQGPLFEILNTSPEKTI